VIVALDVVAMLAAIASALLWFMASGRSLRRVHKGEVLDEHDVNRIITAFNRNQILNGRAALATGISAVAVGLRFLVQFLGLA
jgi:uncharacterized membrane protein